jgi:hypothetical protein
VKLIGRVCKTSDANDAPENPQLKTNDSGDEYCKYQIAVNRKLYIEGSGLEEHSDYLWVRSFNRNAEKDALALSVNSLIYLDAYVRSFTAKQRIDACINCGKSYTFSNTGFEVIPYSVEYLRDCHLPDPVERELMEQEYYEAEE